MGRILGELKHLLDTLERHKLITQLVYCFNLDKMAGRKCPS